ncbi:hypothetical protein SAY87_003033 [Trapa incisa]|uniref:Dynein light chain n=1 Tax=Trapa incisa TaxID=236973 RepID=A0AAN7KK91_9MYRT|nr:hypothetical protein SAY87_003033 [Trapa incisa]
MAHNPKYRRSLTTPESPCSPSLRNHCLRSRAGVEEEVVDIEKFDKQRRVRFADRAEEFDAAYGPAWHCIVGVNFGSFVTHSVGGFMYSMNHKMYILLFKASVPSAK